MKFKRSPNFEAVLAFAENLVRNSTAEEAKGFDTFGWLNAWLDVPQPALRGQKPSEILDQPNGVETVIRVLGAIESGAYQ